MISNFLNHADFIEDFFLFPLLTKTARKDGNHSGPCGDRRREHNGQIIAGIDGLKEKKGGKGGAAVVRRLWRQGNIIFQLES